VIPPARVGNIHRRIRVRAPAHRQNGQQKEKRQTGGGKSFSHGISMPEDTEKEKWTKPRQCYLRLFQNFSFWKASLDLWEKTGFRPFFQEPSTKPTGFWERL
jgi:hypothetical protein